MKITHLKCHWNLPGANELKIRRSQDRLFFNMGILILVRRHLYIETAPCFLCFPEYGAEVPVHADLSQWREPALPQFPTGLQRDLQSQGPQTIQSLSLPQNQEKDICTHINREGRGSLGSVSDIFVPGGSLTHWPLGDVAVINKSHNVPVPYPAIHHSEQIFRSNFKYL